MLVYNVTCKVSWHIHDAWFEWMKLVHIPQVMQTGLFTRYQVLKLLETDEHEGPTYAIQYYVEDHENYENYINTYAGGFRQEMLEKWGADYVSFRSLMEVIN